MPRSRESAPHNELKDILDSPQVAKPYDQIIDTKGDDIADSTGTVSPSDVADLLNRQLTTKGLSALERLELAYSKPSKVVKSTNNRRPQHTSQGRIDQLEGKTRPWELGEDEIDAIGKDNARRRLQNSTNGNTPGKETVVTPLATATETDESADSDASSSFDVIRKQMQDRHEASGNAAIADLVNFDDNFSAHQEKGVSGRHAGAFMGKADLQNIALWQDEIRDGLGDRQQENELKKQSEAFRPALAGIETALAENADKVADSDSSVTEMGLIRGELVKSGVASSLDVGKMSDDEINNLLEYARPDHESIEAPASEKVVLTSPDAPAHDAIIEGELTEDDAAEIADRPTLTPPDAPAHDAIIEGTDDVQHITDTRERRFAKFTPTYWITRMQTASFMRNERPANAPEQHRSRKVLIGAVGTVAVGLFAYLALRGHDTSGFQEAAAASGGPKPGAAEATTTVAAEVAAKAAEQAPAFSNEALTISSGEGWIHQLQDMGFTSNEIPGVLKKLANSNDPAIREWVYTMKDGNPGLAKPGQMPANVLQSIQKLR